MLIKTLLLSILLVYSSHSIADSNNELEKKINENYVEMNRIMNEVNEVKTHNEKHILMMGHLKMLDESMSLLKQMKPHASGTDHTSELEMHMLYQKTMMMELMMEQLIESHKLMIKKN